MAAGGLTVMPKAEQPPGHNAPSMAERVYQHLKAELLAFRLLPGDRFTETALAKRLQASRTPVREALYRLQQEGVMAVHFRSGWQVKPFDFEQIEALYDLRITLERAAAEKICQLPSPPPVLEALCTTWCPTLPTEQATDTHLGELDEHFHCQLVAAAGNPEMTRVHQDITERLRIVRRLDFTRQDRVAATYREHSAILTALLANRPDQAAEQLTRHIRQSQATVRAITMEKIRQAARHFQQAELGTDPPD